MYCFRKVTDDLYWVGADDHRLALFENIHPLYHGISYNSYLLLDEKTVLFDTVDWAVGRQFMENVRAVLRNRPLDYLVINHVEPDHAASIEEVLLRWPNVKIITSPKAVLLLHQFGCPIDGCSVEQVKEGDTRCFGKHTVTFVNAPMVHWPEVMVTYDQTNGVLFSADAFGSFHALDGKLFADEVDFDHEWLDEARRYYTNIVGKYGPQVQSLLKKADTLDIKMICPLHGLVWRKDIGYFLDKYMHWSTYEPEEKGVMIVYASMYGNTETAAEILAAKLAERGVTNTRLYDVSSTHVSYLISDLFKYSHLVLASVTYNLGIFPPMHNFLMDMKALNLQNRTCAIIENGSWACRCGSLMRTCLSEMKHMRVLEDGVVMASSLHEQDLPELDTLADSLTASLKE
ncbi:MULTISPECIES: FprA family A-type flavoprotein [Caproicibacterium]|jgi:flavorubredoxin|uniref:MBL fold metallo-hydrolase n=1 Tax=Caproicibacterium lactatifermentans TaxID=2666138 RepID=A0ABX6PWA1_9FIRM|nr:FprA family A-type flavoprotein [Caproicibacterium lactatifermentans]ARP49879.1 MBL fold metallo-hydrolase [Ruminococcaceae bacterium CPB6]MDD4807715.1 FprA family A-type flavoprotein [Oscillospiraceae bacterium]QKO30585.1 MBL fold metallo-hydrolase [Caproicibacterium lactatifermentans]